MYTSAASNISRYFSFTDFIGRPLVDFPMGYPILLGLLSFLTGLPAIQYAPLLNAVLFCTLIFLASTLLNRFRNRSVMGKAAVLSLLACSPCLLEIYNMVWSETLFLVWILFFLLQIHRYLRMQSLVSLLAAGMIAALAFVTRYAGISLLAAGSMLLLFYEGPARKKKIGHLFLFMLTGISLVSVNLLRNRMATGKSTGVRELAQRGLYENILQLGQVLSEWLPFLRGHEKTAAVLFLLFLAIIVMGIVYRMLQQQYYASAENVVAVFFLVYTVFMLGVATVSRFENLSSRLLSPLYVPLVLAGYSGVAWVRKRIRGYAGYFITLLCLVLFSAFQYHHYQLNAEAWEGIRDAGMPGYTEDSWTRSPTAAYLRKQAAALKAPVFGNANDAVYFLTGIHALPLPHKEIQSEIDVFLRQRKFYLVWFQDGENTDLVELDFIKQHQQLQTVQHFADGAVYFFSDKPEPGLQ